MRSHWITITLPKRLIVEVLKCFGMNPREYQLNKMPIQSFVKLNLNKEGAFNMNISRKIEVEQLRNRKSELFDKEVLNILNGQVMYEEFKTKS